MQHEVQLEVVRNLLLFVVGLERQREEMLEVGGGEALMVFQLEALRSIRRNGSDLRGEDGGALRVDAVGLAHFKEARVDRLQAGLVVDLLGALALEDDSGDARDAIPYGEV